MSCDKFRKENDEVYYCNERFPRVSGADIDFLKGRARENWRLRARICLHRSPTDALHDMILVFHGSTYFRPLRHTERPQIFHVLEGALSLALLDDAGAVIEVIQLSASDPDGAFETILPLGVWYTFVLRTEWLVIRETTTGPMTATDREYALFAPDERAPNARDYARALEHQVDRVLDSR